MKLIINKKNVKEMYVALQRAVAMYGLLHAHARGETDLTEDQLANVVTVVSTEASEVLVRVRGGDTPIPIRPPRWAALARRRPRRVSKAGYH